MTPRQADILHAAVREYIRTGVPVGSETLADRLRADVSPATVRSECAVLEDGGFLAHPHTSAGRIPTAAGYREYANRYINGARSTRVASHVRVVEETIQADSERTLARELAHDLAALSHTLAIVAVENSARYEAGLGSLFRMPEFAERPHADEIEELVDVFDARAPEIAARAEQGPLVYIDGENPWVRTRRVSMIVTAPVLPSGLPVVAALVGPLRMPYDRHLALLHAVHHLLRAAR